MGEQFYILSLVLSALVSSLFFLFQAHRAGFPRKTLWMTTVLMVLFGIFFSRLFYFVFRIQYLVPMYGWGRFFHFTIRGMAFGGALIGVLLAGLTSARATRQDAHRLLDISSLSAVLMLALARLSEFFTDIGQGDYVEFEGLHFFPVAVQNEYGEWYWAVFMLQAAAALLIFLYLKKRRGAFPGETWQIALVTVMLAQIIFESMRAESLKMGFVRVHQLAASLGLAVMAAAFLFRAKRAGRAEKFLRLFPILFSLGMVLLVSIEYSLDKWQEAPHAALYGAMALVLLAMGAAMEKTRRLCAKRLAPISSLPLYAINDDAYDTARFCLVPQYAATVVQEQQVKV